MFICDRGAVIMVKVIYFDEGSATDFLQIYYGCSIAITDEKEGTVGYKLNGKSHKQACVGNNFLFFLKACFSISRNAEISKSNGSLLKTTISNTILAGFVNFTSNQEIDNKDIEVFKDFKLSVIKDSFAFAKMLKEDSKLSEEVADYNFLEFDVNR